MSENKAYFASLVGLAGNTLLFVLKLIIGLMTNSLAVISDAINSFTDILASISITWAVLISNKKADEYHPFGHYRAEPIAGLIVAIFTGIVAFEVFKEGIIRFLDNGNVIFSYLSIAVLSFSIVLKIGMYFYLKGVARQTKSCALEATAIDCRNDVLASSVALISVIGVFFDIAILDSIAAIIISFWIGWSGYEIGRENINYLMGKAPSKEILNKCKKSALAVDGVKSIHDILAHYVGVYIHLEVHVEVDKNLSTQESHDIGKKVKVAILEHEAISQVFVHVDPV